MLCTKQSSNWVKSHECNVHMDHVRADFPWGSIKSARCLRGSSLSADCSLGSRQSSDCSWLSHKGQANQLIVHEDESISWILMAITWGSTDQVNQLNSHGYHMRIRSISWLFMRIKSISWLFTTIPWGWSQSGWVSWLFITITWGLCQSADCPWESHEDQVSQLIVHYYHMSIKPFSWLFMTITWG